MGLFNDLKKTALGKIVDTMEKSLGGIMDSPAKPAESNISPVRPVDAMNTAPISSPVSVEQKFDEILASEFADFQVARNVSPESVGISAPSPCRPYTYALLRGGQTAAVIMLTPHNRDHNSAFLNAKRAAMNSTAAFLNFYTHFQNERSYVVSRIRNAL